MPQPEDYLAPYQEAVDDHGAAFGVTLWANERSQRLRFEAFTQMCFLAGKRVLDAGCSRGDLAEYLLEHDIRYGRYIGVDGVSEVIEFAHQRDLADVEFVAGDFVQRPELLSTGDPQIIVMSGTLNTMGLDLTKQVLETAWDAAGEALMFNFLTTTHGPKAPPQEYPAQRLDAHALLDWAFAKTWAVQYRQDYFPQAHDATILMRKV